VADAASEDDRQLLYSLGRDYRDTITDFRMAAVRDGLDAVSEALEYGDALEDIELNNYLSTYGLLEWRMSDSAASSWEREALLEYGEFESIETWLEVAYDMARYDVFQEVVTALEDFEDDF
jgi:hypothetical protein